MIDEAISVQCSKLKALLSVPFFLDDTDDRRQEAKTITDLIQKLEEMKQEQKQKQTKYNDMPRFNRLVEEVRKKKNSSQDIKKRDRR